MKALASPVPAKPPAALDKNAPVVAVLDASPFGVTKPDVSGHGYAVSRVIGHLSCVGGANAPDCKDFVHPYVALPLVQGPGGWQPGPNGGFIGYFHDLFDAFQAALADRPTDGHLIMNLSLGWDPVTTAPNGPEEHEMRTLLELAYCQGVLVIGAAGNGNTTSQAPVLPAALESRRKHAGQAKVPDGIRRREPETPFKRLRAAHPLRRQRRPLRRAVADRARVGASANRRLRDGRDGARAERRVLPASQRHLDVSSGGQRHRSRRLATQSRPRRCAGHDGRVQGRRRAGEKEQGEPNGELQRQYGPRSVSWLAGRARHAVRRSAEDAGWTCGGHVHHAGSPEAGRSQDPGYVPAATAAGIPNPPVLNAPCGITNCGVPLGPNPGQELAAVGPLGVATCGTCRLFVNGGNGMLTGSLDFNGGPPAPFYTTVVLYDSNWSPHYYQPFQWTNNPNGWFWQGMPSGSTQDVIAGEIDWGFYVERRVVDRRSVHCRYRRDDPAAAAGSRRGRARNGRRARARARAPRRATRRPPM